MASKNNVEINSAIIKELKGYSDIDLKLDSEGVCYWKSKSDDLLHKIFSIDQGRFDAEFYTGYVLDELEAIDKAYCFDYSDITEFLETAYRYKE